MINWLGEYPTGIIFDTASGVGVPINNVVPTLEDFFNWYPDNRRVLLSTNGGSLWLVDPLNGEHDALAVPGYGGIDGAAASPDGSRVVYSCVQCNPSSDTQVHLVNPAGRDDQLLFETPMRSSIFCLVSGR